jgi:flagellar biosynthesis protein FlhF
MVKNELGPDAVILAARDNRKSFGIGGQPSVEVTAAVSEFTLQKKRFVESRLPEKAREKFQTSGAKTQRQIIDKMVERRLRDAEREQAPKRPITPISYIDIQDDEVESVPRRQAAYERAAGRSVSDLLHDFNRAIESNESGDDGEFEEWQERPAREAVRAMSREPQQGPAAPGAVPGQDRAMARIRDAAREAWKNNPFMDERAKSNAGGRATASKRTGPAVGGAAASGAEMVEEEAELAPPRTPVSASEMAKESEIATLKNEITRLQSMIEGIQKVPQAVVQMHPGADFGLPFDLSFMYQKLTEVGVTIDHTVEILQAAVKEIDPVAMKKRPIVDAWVARWFLSNVHVAQSPYQGRLHLFVGGAGSGKTSTLVKMASHLVVKEHKKVAILTTDSFKVGAVDQLKIYCQILNVPFAVLRSRRDWEWVLSQLGHVDHILVDFPGLQLRDLDEIHLLKSLLPPDGNAPIAHFCASATTKDGDAYEMARRYRVTDYNDLMFTNLDQSVQHGIIYNLQRKTGKPLHSFGIGPRIPEDYEPATKERVLDLIFKLTKLRRETR